jgi:hypothetical protein
MKQGSYFFSGNQEEIINGILSLLFCKEYYREISFYSHFINDSQPVDYRQKIGTILEYMQKSNLILIRKETEDGLKQPANSNESLKNTINFSTESARVYLRQYGKEVLAEGGINKSVTYKQLNSNVK